MLTRNVAICLGITGLSSVLLFLYFKHRVNNVEEKLNAMFQLVQSHAQQNFAPPPIRVVQQPTETVYAKQNKIEVSEDESESESDSESDYSDDEEADNLQIEQHNLEKSFQPETISQEVSDVLEETVAKSAMNNVKNQLNEVDVEINNLEEIDNDENDNDDNDDNNDNDENELFEDNQDENTGDDVKKMTISPSLMDYEAFKVPDLKSICQQRQLVGYSSLKKKDLVDLLKNSDQEALGAE